MYNDAEKELRKVLLAARKAIKKKDLRTANNALSYASFLANQMREHQLMSDYEKQIGKRK